MGAPADSATKLFASCLAVLMSQLEVKLFRLRVRYVKGGAVTWMCHPLLLGEQDLDVPTSRA
jgi:hypothetical protein